MYHDLPRVARFWSVLRAIDQNLAETARNKAHPCGGRLHAASYLCKPRGTPVQQSEAWSSRQTANSESDGVQ